MASQGAHLDFDDQRPPSLLRPRRRHAADFAGGAAVAAFTHLGVPLLILFITGVLKLIGAISEDAAPVVTERHVVEARFVKLGVPFDPRRLPNRRVPVLSTAPRDGLVVSKNMNPRHNEQDAGPRPENPVEDLLTRLGDRAQTFAERTTPLEQEGREDGIEEGTEREAAAGDIYAGHLVLFFRRGWTVPETVPEEEMRTLRVSLAVTISGDGHIASFRVRSGSGNALFDQSAVDRLQQLQDSGATIPEPPPEVAQQYLGQTTDVDYNGRNAHR